MEDSLHIFTLDTLMMKNGHIQLMNDGISGIASLEDHLLFSGASGDHIGDFGTGIFYKDSHNVWIHHPQPIESTEEPSILQPIGSGFFEMLPITTQYNNITYDLAVSSEFAWITSWAGGLRRISVDSLTSETAKWSPVPLPEDNQTELFTCDESIFDDSLNIISDFFLNPRDPYDGGNHNHKAFSVLTYGDTVWVGTANGINRGITGDNGCIDWTHYSFQSHNLSGNFVVGLGVQKWNGNRTIWAATMNADTPGEQRGMSYTTDDGYNWKTTLLGERVYNVTSLDSLVLVSSENGLWKTIIYHPDEPPIWAKYSLMSEHSEFSNMEILSNEVFTALADNRPYFNQQTMWVGTPDGLARLKDSSSGNWDIFRVEQNNQMVYAYPNPFSPTVDNRVNGDGFVRFHTGTLSSVKGTLSIFNFAMEEVLSKNYDGNMGDGELKWDGKDRGGYLVANGVYFVHLKLSDNLIQGGELQEHWLKVMVVK
jgi:hypothetical protein